MPKFKYIVKQYMKEAEPSEDSRIKAEEAAARQAAVSSEELAKTSEESDAGGTEDFPSAATTDETATPPSEEVAPTTTAEEETPVESETAEPGMEEQPPSTEEPTADETTSSEEVTSSEEELSNKSNDELNQEMVDLERRISYWEDIYKEIPDHQMYLPTPELRKKADAARAIFHDIWDELRKRIKEIEKQVAGVSTSSMTGSEEE